MPSLMNTSSNSLLIVIGDRSGMLQLQHPYLSSFFYNFPAATNVMLLSASFESSGVAT